MSFLFHCCSLAEVMKCLKYFIFREHDIEDEEVITGGEEGTTKSFWQLCLGIKNQALFTLRRHQIIAGLGHGSELGDK